MVDFKGYGYIDEEEFLQFVQVSGEDDQDAEVEAQEALSPAELARRIELLQDVKILRSPNTKECRAVAKKLVVQKYDAGKNVITAGEAGTEMFIVQEGELEAVSADETTKYVDYSLGCAPWATALCYACAGGHLISLWAMLVRVWKSCVAGSRLLHTPLVGWITRNSLSSTIAPTPGRYWV
eukprot:COSAG02_NODE_21587_length_782_cov_1.004392_2_plen_181_part_01